MGKCMSASKSEKSKREGRSLEFSKEVSGLIRHNSNSKNRYSRVL